MCFYNRFILLCCIFCCIGTSDSIAQWEKVGFPGRSIFAIYQLGYTIIGEYGNSFYRSNVYGKTWRYPKSQLDVLQRPTASAQIVIQSCYPNLATDEMNITYSVPSRGEVTLKAYDITGIERGKLIDRVDAAGSNTITWDTKSLPSGTYILRLNTNGESVSKIIQIIR